MIKLAICDDDEKELNSSKSMCEAFLCEHPEFNVRISMYSSSQELLLHAMHQENFDIFLLDIYMPEKSGIELARILKRKNEECQIVFLTTSTAHAIEAFSLHAAHYLVKPYTFQQLEDALFKAITSVNRYRKAQITLKIPGGVQKLYYNDFIYSETERHIQKIYLADSKSISVRISSTELFEQLSKDSRFFKCGSTYIINLEKIEEITVKYIKFDNGEKIPMLRRQYKELLESYTGYFLEGI